MFIRLIAITSSTSRNLEGYSKGFKGINPNLGDKEMKPIKSIVQKAEDKETQRRLEAWQNRIIDALDKFIHGREIVKLKLKLAEKELTMEKKGHISRAKVQRLLGEFEREHFGAENEHPFATISRADFRAFKKELLFSGKGTP